VQFRTNGVLQVSDSDNKRRVLGPYGSEDPIRLQDAPCCAATYGRRLLALDVDALAPTRGCRKLAGPSAFRPNNVPNAARAREKAGSQCELGLHAAGENPMVVGMIRLPLRNLPDIRRVVPAAAPSAAGHS
jgi:hypothetical protein